MLRAEDRCPGLMDLIDGEYFFVIHAPRQSGKTTLLNTLEQRLNADGKYHALYCSLESVQGIHEAPRGISAILNCLQMALKYHPALRNAVPDYLRDNGENIGVRAFLTDLAAAANRPVVVFFDEADCLGGETLISFLRQLRDGYVNRIRAPFVHSLALVGMRNIRDYRVQVRPDSQTLGSASPFNIAKAAMTLNYFSRDEIAALYQQYTDATGQAFPPELVNQVFYLTQGQPWLVNAIAAEIVEKLCNNDARMPLATAMAEEAAQRIIMRRDTHIDSLLERLKEPRVQSIIEPILLGEGDSLQRESSAFQFVRDLGLIRNDRGTLMIANPIYSEVIARTLNADMQLSLSQELIHRWMDETHINMTGLLQGFQEFWRDNSEAWRERFEYKEAAPHLILLAYLQRVVNGGAKISREFATGTRRVDVCVEYGGKRYPIEMKLMRGPKTRDEGLAQVAKYMDSLGAKEGWLLLFEVQSNVPWENRLKWESLARDGRTIHVVGV
jgi:hypothetical protein